LHDQKGNFIDINKQVTKLLGYGKKELIGKRFDKTGIFSKESTRKTFDSFARRMKGVTTIPPYEIDIISNGIIPDGTLICTISPTFLPISPWAIAATYVELELHHCVQYLLTNSYMRQQNL